MTGTRSHRTLGGLRTAVASAAVCLALALTACGSASSSSSVDDSAAAPPATTSPGIGAADGFQDPDLGTTASNASQGITPTRVTIPSIGVDSDLETLGLESDGRIQPPVAWEKAGWYSKGVVPGDVGPAVIAGHVDSPYGPAVFLDLVSLAEGDEIDVTLSDGTVDTYRVDGSLSASKADFPTSEVYKSTPTPQLRVITCGGDYDASTGHYVDNLVVFATLVADRD
ncbi:class F sortase [Labedella endophytica]|uniref:Class F sortase n=1 Tax=Labedella endophytica TaxID=1523160 RepID=A0A433JW42_9MICO|nr:class F sortase [Labedella endophytica]RUR03193.1 class F sortase [Labedella endophytica]